MACATCEGKRPCAHCDPGAALPPAERPPDVGMLDPVAHLASITHRFTQFIDEFRGLVLNDCLRSETLKFDANGQAEVRPHVPYAAVAVWSHSSSLVTVADQSMAGVAPVVGIGVQIIPANAWACWAITGTHLSLYGTPGDTVTVAVYAKPLPPGGGSIGATGPTIIPGDTVANPTTAIPEIAALGMVWDGQVNQWTRARNAQPDSQGPGGVPAVTPYLVDVATTALNRARASGNGIVAGTDTLGATQAVMHPSSTPTGATAAANTAVVTTYAAVAGQRHRLTLLAYSFSGAAPAAATTLIVQDGATTVFAIDVRNTLNTPDYVPLPPGGIQGSINSPLVITLAAGGGAAVGKLNTAKVTG